MGQNPFIAAAIRVGVLVAAAALILFGGRYALETAFKGGPGGPGGRGGPVPVAIETVGSFTFKDRIYALGTGRANESVTITAKVTETVSKVNFEEGATVEADAILIELTDEEESGDLDAARAQLAEAVVELQRLTELAAKGNVSQSRLDQAIAARNAAAGRVRALEARLADRLVRAPFKGMVGLRYVSPGSLVRPGDVITTLDDTGIIKAEASVPEALIGPLKRGLKIEAKAAAYPDRIFSGEVAAIDTRVAEADRTVRIRMPIPNPEGLLKPGMLLTIAIITDEVTSPSISETSLVALREEVFVYKIAEGKAERVKIRIGREESGRIQVLEGLAPGDQVVAGGTNRLRPGAAVMIVRIDGTPVGPPAGKPAS